MNADTGDQFVGIPYVLQKFGFARRTLYRWIADDKFPKPEKVGSRSKYKKSLIDKLFNNWGTGGGTPGAI